jgi:16S rRNA (uracil1498-N3)-methyltransferase
VVPVISRRCVARPDKKGLAKKVERLNKIARSSAMQSMRGIVPVVQDAVDYDRALEMMKNYDTAYICYEDEHGLVINKNAISGKKIAILVGPEGGIDESEAQDAKNAGIPCISVTWGFKDRAFLQANGANVYAQTPMDIIKLLEEVIWH